MIVDNYKLIREYLDFSDKNMFYMVQLQQRKKDDNTFPANNRTVKTYFIDNINDYDALEPEIKRLSDETGSRVYIRINRRSYQKVLIEVLRESTKMMEDNNYQHLKNLVTSSAGQVNSEPNKKWIVDVDNKNLEFCLDVIEIVKQCSGTVYYIVPTLHGFHLITSKFNSKLFSEHYPEIDIHKDNPTLLYFKHE